MTPKLSSLILALALGLVIVPARVGAQEDAASGESGEKNETTSESADQEAEPKTSDDESGSSEGSDAPADADKKADKSDGEKADEASEGESAKAEGEDGGEEASGGEGEKQAEVGPGGKKLRTDYPGTDEAMKGQMETDRIEGLQFQEGQDPSEAYDVQIQELETKIGDLKEKVFQSKSRVVLLRETVLGGNLSGSRAMIVHKDDLGGRFKLRRAMYSLDGNRIFNESEKTGGIKGQKQMKIYDGNITAGNHNVSVLLEYQGSGFGVFNYMKGYQFKITSSCQFKAEQGKATVLRFRSVPKGGAFSDVTKRPGIKCEITTSDLSEESGSEESVGAEESGASEEEGQNEQADDGGAEESASN